MLVEGECVGKFSGSDRHGGAAIDWMLGWVDTHPFGIVDVTVDVAVQLFFQKRDAALVHVHMVPMCGW